MSRARKSKARRIQVVRNVLHDDIMEVVIASIERPRYTLLKRQEYKADYRSLEYGKKRKIR